VPCFDKEEGMKTLETRDDLTINTEHNKHSIRHWFTECFNFL